MTNLFSELMSNPSIKTVIATGGIVALTSGLGILLAGWRNFCNFFAAIKRFIIITEIIQHPRLARAVIRNIILTTDIPLGHTYHYFIPSVYKKNDKKRAFPLFRNFPGECLYRKGFKFFYLEYNMVDCATIKYLRWTFAARHFIDSGLILMKNDISNEIAQSEGYFKKPLRIIPISGTRFDQTYSSSDASSRAQKSITKSSNLSTPQTDGGPPIQDTSHHGIGWFFGQPDECIKSGLCVNADRTEFVTDFRSGSNNSYFLTPELEILVEEFTRWLSLGDWYRERNIPWKRGLALSGVPGSGKTSFVRYLAMRFGIPLYVVDLSSMTNTDLKEVWETISNNTPAIILFEDIDSVFDGRTNVTNIDGVKPGVSFDCFLNVLDGVSVSDGMYTIITTNHPEKLDEAIAKHNIGQGGNFIPTRPGRIDTVAHIGKATEDVKLQIANKILDKWTAEIPNQMKEAGEDTAAQMQERCIRKASQMIEHEFKSTTPNLTTIKD